MGRAAIAAARRLLDEEIFQQAVIAGLPEAIAEAELADADGRAVTDRAEQVVG